MVGEEELRGYASSPCMMHEIEVPEVDPAGDEDVQLYYLYIEERCGGFGWQLRAHERDEPIEIGKESFGSERDAQDAGRKALDRFCAYVRRHGPQG